MFRNLTKRLCRTRKNRQRIGQARRKALAGITGQTTPPPRSALIGTFRRWLAEACESWRDSHRTASVRFGFMHKIAIEPLEDRVVLSGFSLLETTFFGGTGDQRGTDVEILGSDIFVSVNENDTGTSSANSFLVKYSAPTDSSTTPVFSKSWNLGTLNGIAVDGSSVYGAGYSHPGAGLTLDGTGGTEVKTLLTNFDADNISGTGAGGSNWAAVIPPGTFNSSPGTSFFVYNGFETFNDAVAVVDGGNTFIYAVGLAQPCSWWTFVVGKYDSSGNILAGATAPSADFTLCSAPIDAKATMPGITELGGSIYIAGGNHDSSDIQRPTVLKYDSDLNLQWTHKDSGLTGDFNSIATDGTSLYAVGQTRGPDTDYLIAKYDQSGNQLWRVITDGGGTTDVLRDVVVLNGRVFAVGYTNAPGAGGEDMVILEIDPANGNILFADTFGGSENDRANRVATDGTDLYVIGETRSFAEGGNSIGENDAVLLRHGLATGNTTPKITSLSLDETIIFENASVTLNGTFTDPDSGDAHTVTVDWDDPNNANASTFALPATNTLTVGQMINSTTDAAVLEITAVNTTIGEVSFRVDHQYLDDGLAPGNGTSEDDSTITVTVSDDAGGSDSSVASASSLAFDFAFGLGSAATDIAAAVITDADGNIYVTGTFNGTVDFDPGPGVFDMTGASPGEPFLAKYSPTGELIILRMLHVILRVRHMTCCREFFEGFHIKFPMVSGQWGRLQAL